MFKGWIIHNVRGLNTTLVIARVFFLLLDCLGVRIVHPRLLKTEIPCRGLDCYLNDGACRGVTFSIVHLSLRFCSPLSVEAIHVLNTVFQIHAKSPNYSSEGFSQHAILLLKQALISKVVGEHQGHLPKEQAWDYFPLIVWMLPGISIAPIISTVPTSILLQVGICLGVGISYLLSLKNMLGTQCFLLLSSSAVLDSFMGVCLNSGKLGGKKAGRGRNFVLHVSLLTPLYSECLS